MQAFAYTTKYYCTNFMKKKVFHKNVFPEIFSISFSQSSETGKVAQIPGNQIGFQVILELKFML